MSYTDPAEWDEVCEECGVWGGRDHRSDCPVLKQREPDLIKVAKAYSDTLKSSTRHSDGRYHNKII